MLYSATDQIHVETNKELRPLTTLGVGGAAKYYVRVQSESELVSALEFAKANGTSVFILGGGSNVLVSDTGFDGLVIHVALDLSARREIQPESKSGYNGGLRRITAGAGENWDSFVRFCVENELAGVECLSGIPGSVGGTPVQNVGAYGQEVSQTIVAVRCIDSVTMEPVVFSKAECQFAYRQSIFNSSHRSRYIVYSVDFELKHGGAPRLAYRDLIEHFQESRPTLAEVRDAVIAIRRKKSMVIDPDDPNSKSAGSFFKNPVISVRKFAELNRKSGVNVPNFDAGNGSVKIPAAWLIEKAGFEKGHVQGNVGISSNHTLAIINRGSATSSEIIALMNEIVNTVEKQFGIRLVAEPVLVGFEDRF